MTEFVDTNILLYANGINAAREPEKVYIARSSHQSISFHNISVAGLFHFLPIGGGQR